MKGPTIRRVAEMMADLRSPIRAWHSGTSQGKIVDGPFIYFKALHWAWALTADGHWHTWVWED